MNDESSIPDGDLTNNSNRFAHRKQLLNPDEEPDVDFDSAVKDLVQFTNVSHLLNSQPSLAQIQDINNKASPTHLLRSIESLDKNSINNLVHNHPNNSVVSRAVQRNHISESTMSAMNANSSPDINRDPTGASDFHPRDRLREGKPVNTRRILDAHLDGEYQEAVDRDEPEMHHELRSES